MKAVNFENARTLLRWAKEDIDQLETAITPFIEACRIRDTTDVDLDTMEQVFKMRIEGSPPDSTTKLTNYIATGIKHALDHATNAATEILGITLKRGIYFPVGTTPTDLNGFLKASQIPLVLHPVFTSFQTYYTGDGYSGGDDVFRALIASTGPSKHRLLTKSGFNFKIIKAFGINHHLLGFRMTPGGGKVEGEIEIGRAPFAPEHNYYADIFVFIAFDKVERLDGLNVLSVLKHCHSEAVRMISEIEDAVTSIRAGH